LISSCREKSEKLEKTTVQTSTEKEVDEQINYKNVVMAMYSPAVKLGPCKYIDGTRKQNHQCRRDSGLPDALREAKRLAMTHCEEQFKYDRWNCSIETRGKRNIFKKVSSPS
jgi:wnt family